MIELHQLIDWPIVLDDNAKRRLLRISADLDRRVDDLIRTSVEEAALEYFRNRDDDPAI